MALVGASDDPGKTSARPLTYLRDAGWNGAAYPINPHRESVLGARSWPSLSALPEVPDHVFVLTGAAAAVDAVRECAELGVPVVTVMASGFAEAGPAGLELQHDLLWAVRGSATRVLGPSSLGVVNVHERLALTANAAFAERVLPLGDVFVASQSGSVIGALVSRGLAMGIGFAGLVSTGGEVDLSLGEVCEATLDDPRVGSYALFLESLSRVADLRRFAVAAAQRGRPVMAYKLGRSSAAAELTLSHTGVMAGDDDTATAVLADLGIARVHTFEALLEGQLLVRRLPPPTAPSRRLRVAVVTTTGGAAAMVIDQLAVRGVQVERPSERTSRRLADVGIDVGSSRLVDLTLAGTRYEVMKAALDVLLTADEYDLVIAVAGSSARFQPELAVRPIADSVGTGAPLAAFVVPEAPEALRLLRTAGVPAFRTPESCADAVAAAASCRPARAGTSWPDPAGVPTPLDEDVSYRVMDALGVPRAPHAVVHLATPVRELPFAGPVVVKALSAQLPHKSDVGGVVPGVTDVPGLQAAVAAIAETVGRLAPTVELRRCLVQPMRVGLAEVLVGYRLDPDVGPLVLLASGGVTAELFDDRSIRPAPVDLDTAREMVGELVSLKVLAGYRGMPRGDLESLAGIVVALSRAADLDGPTVLQAEINPVMVLSAGQGAVAVDALVVMAVPATTTEVGT